MSVLNVFIYRPDRGISKQAAKVLPDLCYTPQGQNYRDWQKDQEDAQQYKIETIKRDLAKANRTNSHFVEVAW